MLLLAWFFTPRLKIPPRPITPPVEIEIHDEGGPIYYEGEDEPEPEYYEEPREEKFEDRVGIGYYDEKTVKNPDHHFLHTPDKKER